MRIIVDISELRPGGETGGVKQFLFEAIRTVRGILENTASFVFLTNSATHTEVLESLAGNTDELVCVHRSPDAAPPAESSFHPRERVMIPPPAHLAHAVRGDVFYAPFGTVRNASPGIPILSFVADILHRDYPLTLSPSDIAHRETTFQAAVDRSYAFQCNSVHVAERLQELYGVESDRTFHTYNLIHRRLEKQEDAPRLKALPDERFFYYPANAWPHKNHDVLLVAYRSYLSQVEETPWPLVLTGHDNGMMQERLETAKALRIADHVHFLGYLTENELASVWQNAGALVFPSLHEGFGIPLVEAMHFGVPIIAADVCSIPEVAGQAAIYFDPARPVEIAKSLLSISSDEQLRMRLVKAGTDRLNTLEKENHFLDLADQLGRAGDHWPTPIASGAYQDGWVSDSIVFGLPASAKAGGTFKMHLHDATPDAELCLETPAIPLGSYYVPDIINREVDVRIPENTRSVILRVINARNLNPQDPRKHGARFKYVSFLPDDQASEPFSYAMES